MRRSSAKLNLELPTHDEIRAELAKRTLVDFARYATDDRWQTARHLEAIAEVLERVERGELTRVIINLPPRHGKSQLGTELFPVWYLGRHPDREVMTVSYADDLATTFSRKSRNMFRLLAPKLWGLEVADDSSAVGRWGVKDHPGGMVATGIEGGLTGKGAHLMLIDDPYKNWEASQSPTVRKKVWDEYQATLRTRLAPGGAIVLIQTRWHEDDLSGHLLKLVGTEEGEEWFVLNLPAIAEEKDPMGRAPGAPLWPERFTAADLAATKRALGSLKWDALYQQKPRPSKGKLFNRDWFRYARQDGEYLLLPKQKGAEWEDTRVRLADCRVFQTVDTAASVKTSADHFVVETWLATSISDLILWDVYRTRIEGPDQKRLMKDQYDRYRPIAQGVEDKMFGLTLIQEMMREGLPVKSIAAKGDKLSRAIPIAARYEAGTVFHRSGAPWMDEYENELIAFTGAEGGQDDQVDCAAYAGIWLADGLIAAAPQGESSSSTTEELLGVQSTTPGRGALPAALLNRMRGGDRS